MNNINKLEYLAEFEKALQNYEVSKEGYKILHDSSLVLLIAPSSSGRNTIIRELVKTGDYHFIISDTTRKPRINDGVPEQNGREYWFKSEAEFLGDLKSGGYLEAEIIHNQQVSGISLRELEQSIKENRISVTDIDIGGVENVRKLKPDTKIILVLPPSYEEWMNRLKARGDMHPMEITRRKATAKRILTAGLHDNYFKFVINDDLKNAVMATNHLARGDKNLHDQEHTREIAAQIISKL